MTIHKISISTLSPIHIGCDEIYEPSTFVIHDNVLHALDPANLAHAMTDNERKELGKLANQREPIGAIQRFFRDNAQRLSAVSHHEVAVAEAIAAEYDQKAGKAAQRGGGEPVYNLYHIARTAFSPIDNAAYIPGSSLKGSIRTAWLNHINKGESLSSAELRDKRNAAAKLQQRLLGYESGEFQHDPFRHVELADAHSEADTLPPPTRIVYAISKKKRAPREGERAPKELKVFLETLPDALPSALLSEIRLNEKTSIKKIEWNALCQACNNFYLPQLKAEIAHPVLGAMIDNEWKRLISGLLTDEFKTLATQKQGFLLRVGRHSGAESVTLDGVRDIKIMGKEGEQPSYRPNTTESRFASLTKSGTSGLLPFGWIWVNASDEVHQGIFDAVRQKLATRSAPLREAHQDQILRREERFEKLAVLAAESRAKAAAQLLAEQAEAAKLVAQQLALAAMSPNLRIVEEFSQAFSAQVEKLRGNKDNPHTAFHQKAKDLAKIAVEGESWSVDEKRAAADAIECWLPQVIKIDIKDERKKLKLTALRGT